MWWAHIGDDDYVYRPSVFPLSFPKKQFDRSKLFNLVYAAPDVLRGSLVWERFAPTAVYIHKYGCRLASKMNKRKFEEKGSLPAKDRRIYCGAYGMKVRSVRALVGLAELSEVIGADVTHLFEDGEIAHAELKIVLMAGEADLEGTKTAILDRLWNASCGPLQHVCDADTDIDKHPSNLLTVGGAGKYEHNAGPLHQFWRMVKYHLSSWLWHRGLFSR